jgi:DNA-binding NarL/FixJ family response regulator
MMNRITTLASAAPPTIREKKQRLDSLTPRQVEVLQGVSKGWTNKQIADALYIECGTVKNHVHHILKKLAVASRYEAAHVYKQEYQQERNEAATAVS